MYRKVARTIIDVTDWIKEADKIYKQCATEKELTNMTKWMVKYLKSKKDLFKQYLEMGSL